MTDPLASSARIAQQNSDFFAENSAYARRIQSLRTYKRIHQAINREIDGIDRLLDIGNGGVFDYNIELVKEIVGVDLFIDDTQLDRLPANVTLRQGNALSLDEDSNSYGGALFALVLHHLVEETAGTVVDNFRQALLEAHRILAPNGKLILVESCIQRWFYPVEQLLFPALVKFTKLQKTGHPPTLQLPIDVVSQLVVDIFGTVSATRIPTGPIMLHFGLPWPTPLSPARPWMLTAIKPTL